MPLTKVDEYYLRSRSAPVIRCRGFFLLCQHTVWYVGTINFNVPVQNNELCQHTVWYVGTITHLFHGTGAIPVLFCLFRVLLKKSLCNSDGFIIKKGTPIEAPYLRFKTLRHSGVLIPSFAVPLQIVKRNSKIRYIFT